LLEQPERRAEDPKIRPSVEFLLASAGPDGGFAWGSGSSNDSDSDSTGYVLRALAVANRTAGPELGRSLDPVLRSAVRYLTVRQDRRGGFSVWRSCVLPARPGSMSFRTQQIFDLATADTTGRVLVALCAAGLGWRDRPVRRAVRDLIRLQHRNGGWWCRWCAGFIPGTFFVLEALAALGLRCGVVPNGGGDRLKSAAYRSMVRGFDFLLAHQNADGGWGETTLADADDRWAGVGESRPLQTAFALIGLIGCGYSTDSNEVECGIGWLLDSMDREGSWHDEQAVFTLFARAWYYRYPLNNLIMPLRALTAYLRAIDSR
jgi:squalene-hopene/tetraprenyl-beta-curcumene cyclase